MRCTDISVIYKRHLLIYNIFVNHVKNNVICYDIKIEHRYCTACYIHGNTY